MAVTAKFLADFTSFQDATKKATFELKSFETQTATVEKRLAAMADSFTGRRILSEATLATEAVQRIGGATKLTEAQQARVNALVTEAIEQYRALGQKAPADMLALERATRRVKDAQQEVGTQVVNTSEFFQQRSRQSAEGLGLVGTAARALGPALAAAFSVGKIVTFARDAADAGDELQTLKERTGANVVALQEWEGIAQKARTTLEAMAKNAEQLGIRLNKGDGSAVAGVKDLGLKLEELIAMRPEDRFARVMTALGGVGDEARRAAIGTAVMGKGFSEVAAAADGSFEQMRTNARETLKTLSESQVKALASADNAWEHFQSRVKRGSQIITASIVEAFTMPADWFESAIGADDIDDTFDRLKKMSAESASELENLRKKLQPPGDGIEGYRALTAEVAAAHREFRNLDEGQEARIRNSILLGKSVEDLAREYGITKRAIEFVIEASKLQAEQDEINTKKTKERTEAEKRLREEHEKQVKGARNLLFGGDRQNDAVAQARLYIEALGDVSKVTLLTGDAQAKLAEIMRAGVEALVLQGKATDAQTSLFETYRLKATETGRDAAAAFSLMQAQAKLLADVDRDAAHALEETDRAIQRMRDSAQATTPAIRGMNDELARTISIQAQVPAGFSFQDAYTQAGFIVHNSIGGLRPMAEGGIVTRPTAILAGERGPEAIVPLYGRSGMGWGGINVTIAAPALFLRDRSSMNEFVGVIKRELLSSLAGQRKLPGA